MSNSTQESLRVVGNNLAAVKGSVTALEAERDALVAQLPQNTPVKGGSKDVALMLRSVQVTGPLGNAINAVEKSIITTDPNKVKALQEANPSAPGVYCIKPPQFAEIIEENWARVCDG
jgi:hypothetical protein